MFENSGAKIKVLAKGMFENSGAKIKELAKVVFAVSVVGALVLAITFGRTYDRYDGTKFLLILLPSLLGSYVSSLFIDAFGTLVMNSSALVAKSEAYAADGEMAMEDDEQGKERRKIHLEDEGMFENSGAKIKVLAKGMFENSGAKIKVLAKVVFAVSVVVALGLAITFGRTVDRYDGTKFSFWKFLLILLPSLLGGYVSALFIDAFGTLVMNSGALVAKSEAHAADGEMSMEDDEQGKER